MRILDRYILKSVLGVFILCIFSFLWLFVVIDIFSHLDDILKAKVALNLLATYYLSCLPVMFVQVAPISCLLATLFTFGKLNRNNEIIAMRSSGLSILQISKSVIIFGFIVSLLLFWVNDRLVPRSLFLTQKIKAYMDGGTKNTKDKGSETLSNLSIYGLKNRLFFVTRFSPDTNTMEGITILEHNKKQDITKKIIANKGIYNNGIWTFYQCITYDFDAAGQMKNEPGYMEEEIMAIPETPQDFLSQRQSPDYMTIAQLEFYIEKLSGSGAVSVVRNMRVDLYQRFAQPFTSLIIVLIGIPFSLIMKRKATGMSSLGIAIMVGFLYYVVSAVSIALGKQGVFPPLLAVSLSHIIALILSLRLIVTMP